MVPAVLGCVFAAASVLADPVWSEKGSVDLQNIPNTAATPVPVSVSDQLAFSAKWAYGCDRIASVIANAESVSDYSVFVSEEEEEGTFNWDYLKESKAFLPRDIIYKLTQTLVDSEGVVLDTAYVFVTLTDRDTPVWSGKASADAYDAAEGRSVLIKPDDAISYSAKWAVGHNRKITVYAKENGAGVSSAGDPYVIKESGVEEEGTCVWDYEEIDPSVLPRGSVYTLAYDIVDSSTGYDLSGEVSALPKITILPEPGALAILLLSALAFVRKR